MNQNVSPLISIIIPLYNAANTIIRCLDSVYAQTFSSYEVVIVDDGSTDNSAELVRHHPLYHDTDSCKMVSQQNKGAAAARNLGLSISSGKYVTFIDNDDWIDVDYLETLYMAAEFNDADIVLSGYRRPNQNNRIISDDYFLINKTLSDLINVGNNINTVEPLRDFNRIFMDNYTKRNRKCRP